MKNDSEILAIIGIGGFLLCIIIGVLLNYIM